MSGSGCPALIHRSRSLWLLPSSRVGDRPHADVALCVVGSVL